MTTDLAKETEKNIKRRKEEEQSLCKQVRHLGEKIEEIIKLQAQPSFNYDIDEANRRFKRLILQKDTYLKTLKGEVETREIDKLEAFETSLLNIKLPKFKDYSSTMDIYTFQDLFEKIHLKSTPKVLLPDLLKNNYLENPALSLIRHVDNIEEIWSRLKAAYGDSKTMLTKKISSISRMDGLWKLKDSGKIAEGLTGVINCMKDLLQLAERHILVNNLNLWRCFR